MLNIAIDGPAGAGKSTIAKLVAKDLNIIYVDTGSMYRAVAHYLLQQGVDIQDEAAVSAACTGADITIAYEDGAQQVYCNGENVTPFLRKEETGKAASVTSAVPAVRAHLLQLQKNLAATNDCVMDGRDIGSVVLPGAKVKVYLTASSEERARRRFEELKAAGGDPDFAQIKEDIEKRDYQDMHREISPLIQAPDAVLIDSTDMTIPQVAAKIEELCND